MDFRKAINDDVPVLAKFNAALIENEGHANRMTVPELEQRMAQWLQTDYAAYLFLNGVAPIGYVLYRLEPEWIYLRQFFISREFRRQGIGRAAFGWLVSNVWKDARRIRLDVLVTNDAGIGFWRALHFNDYCLTMELERKQS